jgi:HAMP domain-containing protein
LQVELSQTKRSQKKQPKKATEISWIETNFKRFRRQVRRPNSSFAIQQGQV